MDVVQTCQNTFEEDGVDKTTLAELQQVRGLSIPVFWVQKSAEQLFFVACISIV